MTAALFIDRRLSSFRFTVSNLKSNKDDIRIKLLDFTVSNLKWNKGDIRKKLFDFIVSNLLYEHYINFRVYLTVL